MDDLARDIKKIRSLLNLPSDTIPGVGKRSKYRHITCWGNGIGSEKGQFGEGPKDIAVGPDGNIYVSDPGNFRILRFSTSGEYLGEIGLRNNIPVFHDGCDLFIEKIDCVCDITSITSGDDGLIYAVIPGPEIYKYELSGNLLEHFYINDNNKYYKTGFFAISSIRVKNNYIYVTDEDRHRILKLDSHGSIVKKWGEKGTGDGQFNSPHGMAIDSDSFVYVTDSDNLRVQKFDTDGNFIKKWGIADEKLHKFMPMGIAVDSENNVYVGGLYEMQAIKFDPDGNVITNIGEENIMVETRAIAVDKKGCVYVADLYGQMVHKFAPKFVRKNGMIRLFH